MHRLAKSVQLLRHHHPHQPQTTSSEKLRREKISDTKSEWEKFSNAKSQREFFSKTQNHNEKNLRTQNHRHSDSYLITVNYRDYLSCSYLWVKSFVISTFVFVYFPFCWDSFFATDSKEKHYMNLVNKNTTQRWEQWAKNIDIYMKERTGEQSDREKKKTMFLF